MVRGDRMFLAVVETEMLSLAVLGPVLFCRQGKRRVANISAAIRDGSAHLRTSHARR